MHDAFFHLNFLNAQDTLAQKIYMFGLFFVNFRTLKMGNVSNSQASLVSWFPVSPNAPELAILRKDNLILQSISLSNVTLFSIFFFASGVRLNAIAI